MYMSIISDEVEPDLVRQNLEELPEELDDTYKIYLDRIKKQGSGRAGLAMKTLSWVTFAIRPLTLKQLRHAVANNPVSQQDDEEMLISMCVGFLVVDSRRSQGNGVLP